MATKVQVLVATVDQSDLSLPRRMNICSDAVICNQCGRNGSDAFEYRGFQIRYYHSEWRGVGLNRNDALRNATGDICLIADDDLVYSDGYAEMIDAAFSEYADADVIVFNVDEPQRKKTYIITKPYRVNYLNYMRFATFRFAIRLDKVRKSGIVFNTEFGGGTRYSHGEDTLFLGDCLKKGLKVMALPITLATMSYGRNSTWFKGFNDKYFTDQGALYAAISPKFTSLLCLQDAIRHRKKYSVHGGMIENYKMMMSGAKEFLDQHKNDVCAEERE